jgi:hypothetical protein
MTPHEENDARIRALEKRLDRFDTLYSVGRGVAITLVALGGFTMWLISTAREWIHAMARQ